MRLTINFLVKKARQKSNGEIPIYVRVTLKAKRIELSTYPLYQPRLAS